VAVGIVAVAAALALTACGSSGPSSASGTATGRSAGSSGGTTATTAATTATTAAVSSSTRAPTPHATSVPGASALPTKAQLGSLTNYTFAFTDNASAIDGKVHSPTDFQTTQPAVVLHISGSTYTKLGSTWYKTSQPANQAHQGYATSPYPGAIENFLGLLKVSGVAVTKGAPCTEAGQSGTTFTIGSKELNSSVLSELGTACIADHGGALLSWALGAQGSGVATSTHSASYSFTIDSIGGVPAIPVPSPVKTDG
jgi:hypothetical protein